VPFARAKAADFAADRTPVVVEDSGDERPVRFANVPPLPWKQPPPPPPAVAPPPLAPPPPPALPPPALPPPALPKPSGDKPVLTAAPNPSGDKPVLTGAEPGPMQGSVAKAIAVPAEKPNTVEEADVQEAIEAAVTLVNKYKRRLAAEAGDDEDGAKRRAIEKQAQLMLKVHNLLQLDASGEAPAPATAASSTAAAAASSDSNPAAISQTRPETRDMAVQSETPPTPKAQPKQPPGPPPAQPALLLVQLQSFMQELGYTRLDEFQNGKNLVHHCCYLALKRTVIFRH